MINYQHAEEGQVVPFVHSSLFHTHTHGAKDTMQERREVGDGDSCGLYLPIFRDKRR